MSLVRKRRCSVCRLMKPVLELERHGGYCLHCATRYCRSCGRIWGMGETTCPNCGAAREPRTVP